MKTLQPMSVLNKVKDSVFAATTVDEARNIIRECLQSSKIDSTDKSTMLDDIEKIKTLKKMWQFCTNALLKFEGLGVIK